MTTAIIKVNLIPFLEIEKGLSFEDKILIFIQSLIINLETSNLKIIEKEKIIPSMKEEKNPNFHNVELEIKGKPNKLLIISINNDGLVLFGIFYEEKSQWLEFMKGDEFIDIKKFNAIFPHIITCLQ
ncbi:MAG TPA: hypothetical protein VIK86_00560 [Candidatus Paceibacterota bacterium]